MLQQLKVHGNRIVNSRDEEVMLRGTCIGAWLNMEDFMDAIPGSEHQFRYNAKKILGDEMGEYWFDSFIRHFFTESDAKFLAENGCKVIRVPLNYHHFESDLQPFVYHEKGFQEIDHVLNICEKYNLYVILDMHAAPGGQSSDWHCDNVMRTGLLWTTAEYRKRFVALWGELARRYNHRSVIAGYGILNEPMTNQHLGRVGFNPTKYYTPEWTLMNTLYREVTEEIRKYDTNHIIFLEGDWFSQRFNGLDAPFDNNTAYSSHNYSSIRTKSPFNPDFVETRSEEELLKAYRDEFYAQEGIIYCQKYNVPLWVSEFGMNQYQLQIFNEFGAHWTNWSYKACNRGLSYPKSDCDFFKVIAPVQTKMSPVGQYAITPKRATMLKQIDDLIQSYIEVLDDARVDKDELSFVIKRTLDDIHLAPILQQQYLQLFAGKSKEEIDHIMGSWSFDNCIHDDEMLEISKRFW